jgi:hypothetical protein
VASARKRAKEDETGRCLDCGQKAPTGAVICGKCGSAVSHGACVVCGAADAKERVYLRAAHHDFVQGAHRVKWRDHPISACASCLDQVRGDDFKKLAGVGAMWAGFLLSGLSFVAILVFDLPKYLVVVGVLLLVAAMVARIYPHHRVERRFAVLKEKSEPLKRLEEHLAKGGRGAARFTLTAEIGDKPDAA